MRQSINRSYESSMAKIKRRDHDDVDAGTSKETKKKLKSQGNPIPIPTNNTSIERKQERMRRNLLLPSSSHSRKVNMQQDRDIRTTERTIPVVMASSSKKTKVIKKPDQPEIEASHKSTKRTNSVIEINSDEDDREPARAKKVVVKIKSFSDELMSEELSKKAPIDDEKPTRPQKELASTSAHIDNDKASILLETLSKLKKNKTESSSINQQTPSVSTNIPAEQKESSVKATSPIKRKEYTSSISIKPSTMLRELSSSSSSAVQREPTSPIKVGSIKSNTVEKEASSSANTPTIQKSFPSFKPAKPHIAEGESSSSATPSPIQKEPLHADTDSTKPFTLQRESNGNTKGTSSSIDSSLSEEKPKDVLNSFHLPKKRRLIQKYPEEEDQLPLTNTTPSFSSIFSRNVDSVLSSLYNRKPSEENTSLDKITHSALKEYMLTSRTSSSSNYTSGSVEERVRELTKNFKYDVLQNKNSEQEKIEIHDDYDKPASPKPPSPVELPFDPIDYYQIEPVGQDFHYLTYPFEAKKSVTVYERDFDRLNDETFLNDTLIDVFPKIWADEYPDASIYTFSSFFYTKLAGPNNTINYDTVKRWTAQEDIFKKKFVVIPIAQNSHWFIILVTNPGYCIQGLKSKEYHGNIDEDDVEEVGPNVLDKHKPYIMTLDPLNLSKTAVAKDVLSYLKAEAITKLKINESDFSSPEIVMSDCPRQKNFTDCGVYCLHYMRSLYKYPDRMMSLLYNKNTSETAWDQDHTLPGFRSHLKRMLKREMKKYREYLLLKMETF